MNKYANKLDLEEDIECLPEIEISKREVIFNDNIENDIKDDYQYSREKLSYILSATEAVLKHSIKNLSNDSGPRPIEAVSSLVKVANETVDKIFSLHEKMKKIQPKEEKPIDSEDKKTIKTSINDIIDQIDRIQE